jgi:Protein of unknown function (DUF2752)
MSTALRSRATLAPWAALAAGAGAWLAVTAWRPGDGGPVLCPFRWLTGLDCPFCGSTRAAASLAHGQLGAALDQNAFFMIAILPAAALIWGIWLSRTRAGRPMPVVSNRVLNLSVAVVGAWWVLRLVVPWLGSGLAG